MEHTPVYTYLYNCIYRTPLSLYKRGCMVRCMVTLKEDKKIGITPFLTPVSFEVGKVYTRKQRSTNSMLDKNPGGENER